MPQPNKMDLPERPDDPQIERIQDIDEAKAMIRQMAIENQKIYQRFAGKVNEIIDNVQTWTS